MSGAAKVPGIVTLVSRCGETYVDAMNAARCDLPDRFDDEADCGRRSDDSVEECKLR